VCAIPDRAVSSKDLPKEARREIDSRHLNGIVLQFWLSLELLVPNLRPRAVIRGRRVQAISERALGSAVLPTGEYLYSVESRSGMTVVQVHQIGAASRACFARTFQKAAIPDREDRTRTNRGGDVCHLTARGERGLVLNFSPPKCGNGRCAFRRNADAVYIRYQGSSAGYFTIFNPGSEKISYSEAEKVYLAACETIEREFHQSAPIRPRLTVHLQSTKQLTLPRSRSPAIEVGQE